MINKEAKSTLARLLANENIEVREGNYSTASFDVLNRVLNLPMWKDMGKDVYDLLIGHEVGHALFTPAEGWHDSDIDVAGIPRSYLNIIEDIRIERAVQAQYPGLVGSFKRGYQVLFDEDFFGTKDRDIESYRLPDRINIKAKLGDLVTVPFSDEEKPLVKLCYSVKSWEDVVDAARALYEYMKEQQDDQQDDENQDVSSEPNSGDGEETTANQSVPDNLGSEPTPEENESDADGEKTEQSRSEEAKSPEDDEAPINGTDQDRPEDKVETDEMFRSRERELVDIDDDGTQPIAVSPLSMRDAKTAIVGYKTLLDAREKRFIEYGGSSDRFMDKLMSDYDQFVNENKKIVSSMVREFEMRKAAFRFARAKVSKTGVIDPVKMYSYKYSEDIFSRTTQLADAKNHGMIMLVDYSGSMSNTISQVIRQVITLSMFCRKANIPFRVYGFTSRGRTEPKSFDTNLDLNSISMFELMSNEMSKTDFQKAVYQLYAQSWTLTDGNLYWGGMFQSHYECMSGTPLNECLLVLDKLIPDFKASYGLDKVNLTILTDGEANNMYLVDRSGDVPTNYRKTSLTMNGKRVIVDGRYNGTRTIITEMKKAHKLSTICYYIPYNNRDFRYKLYNFGVMDEEDFKTHRREFLKQKFTSFDDVLGYDRYFILRSGKDLDTKTEDFTVSENAAKGEITRQFKKFAGSKKGNRVLVTRFAEVIA